ncbi:hypothetical protein SSCG_03735 [Streptomyces clavuligerus]|nr:hypothetical protein SSCG_03735 [Streptomyces clavuligerus]
MRSAPPARPAPSAAPRPAATRTAKKPAPPPPPPPSPSPQRFTAVNEQRPLVEPPSGGNIPMVFRVLVTTAPAVVAAVMLRPRRRS